MPHTASDERLAWFRAARLGLFVHWGCSAGPGRGEQIMQRDLMPLAEYDRLADQFRPDPDWAQSLAQSAKRMGAGYVALTTRHHDGYCLFRTTTTPFNAVATGPGRDLVAEFVTAVRDAGLRVGLYYSLVNWRWRGHWDPVAHPEDLSRMVDEVHVQIDELMTQYGTIDVLWYDVPAVPGERTVGGFGYREAKLPVTPAEFYRSAGLNARVRARQPHILINDRSGLPEDFGTPEQQIRPEPSGRMWETCMTLNFPPGWGHLRRPMAEKSCGEVLHHLMATVRLGGNFLFNVGPDGQGRIPASQQAVLDGIGAWMDHHAEAVHGTVPTGIYEQPWQGPVFHYGMFTCRGSTAYLTLFAFPDEHLIINRIAPEIRSATLLTTGAPLTVMRLSNHRWRIGGLPPQPPAPCPPVIRLEFTGPPHLLHYAGAAWLDGAMQPLLPDNQADSEVPL